MGKSKKKDPSKKLALLAKKDAKADKSARKRMKKESNALNAGGGADSNDELKDSAAANVTEPQSLDDLLNVYRKRDVEGNKAIVEALTGFPPPRGNFSMTVVEDQKGKQEVYIFGGEYFDGVESIVVDHLLKWSSSSSSNSQKTSGGDEWKQIIMPSSVPSPPARCAHSTVYYNGALYVFGGELATADYYHHYKDIWRYDIKKQTWSELTSRTGTLPSSRSGHSAIVWKHYMIVFGGFYEAARDTPRWFNDVFVFDLKTQQWMDVPHSKLGTRPEPRSACNVSLINDSVVLHGGFSKLPSAAAVTGKETKVHTDAWLLHLKPIAQGKPPTWEKLLSSSGGTGRGSVTDITNTRNPNGRAATTCATYKNKMIVFGGVVDAELMHHKVDSVFFNDIFCLDVEPRPRWFPLKVRKTIPNKVVNSGRDNGKDPGEEIDRKDDKEDDGCSDVDDLVVDEAEDADDETPQQKGWNIDQLRENMSAFVDGSGNVVYERIDNAEVKSSNPYGRSSGDSEEEKEEEEEEKESDEEDESDQEESKQDGREASNRNVVSTSSSVMVLDPKPKAPEAVQRDAPLPRIKCGSVVHRNTLFIYGGLVEIGDREVTLDDMWSIDLRKRDQWKCVWPGTMHKQVWRGAVHDDDDSYISTGAGEDDDSDGDSDDSGELGGGERKCQEKDILGQTQEVSNLTSEFDLGNELRTPQEEEALADFYSRTKSFWNEEATQTLKLSGGPDEPSKKELKREGFQLARKRFEDLEPVMERMKELNIGQTVSKSKSKKKSKTKSG